MRGAARTRTHTYTELGGMTRRLPAGRAFLYLGGWAYDHWVLFCTMPRTPRWQWAPMASSAPGPTRCRPLTPARQTAHLCRRNHGGPGSRQCLIPSPRVSWLSQIALASKFWASTRFTVVGHIRTSPPLPVSRMTIMVSFSILFVPDSDTGSVIVVFNPYGYPW